jgi:hypothetical protein
MNMAHPPSPGLFGVPGCAGVRAELMQLALLAVCLHVVLPLGGELAADGWG